MQSTTLEGAPGNVDQTNEREGLADVFFGREAAAHAKTDQDTW